MPYPNGYLYLTAHWTVSSANIETGQFGLKFDSTAPATQVLVDACKGPISTFWAAATSAIEPDFRLLFVRLAAIGADGLYVPGTVAYDGVFAPLVPGGGAATPARFPLQVASAASLTTAFPRGRAHRGRIYLPPINGPLTSSYVNQSADCANRANTLAARLSDLNDVMPGPLTVFSKVGAGTKHVVTGVAIGNRPDTERRRARSQLESYSNAVLT